MLNVRRYVPLVLAIASCSPGEDTPGQANPDGGAPIEGVDAGAPPKPKDAGRDARVLGPAVPVEDDKLGCDGNLRIEGAPIDVTRKVILGVFPERTFVSFTDGTFGSVLAEEPVSASRLDEQLDKLESYPIGPLSDLKAATSGNVLQQRTAGRSGFLYAGRTKGSPPTKEASLLGYDFATGEKTQLYYTDTVEGLPMGDWSVSSDEKESYAWVRLGDENALVTWRRAFRKDGVWQPTELDGIPVAQWEEGGKTHFLDARQDVVLTAGGKIESKTPFEMVPDTTTPCANGSVVRTGSSLVTVRNVLSVPCSDPTRYTAPYEIWVHLPNDTTGRKIADGVRTEIASFPMVELHWGPKLDSFVTFDRSDPTKFTAKLQRLDRSLRDLGTPVTVTLPGVFAPTNLVPVAGGYFWFVANMANGGNIVTTSAYRVVCAP